MNLVKEVVIFDDTTIEKVKNEAELAANEAQSHYLSVQGEDSYCGFGWVEVMVSRTNSREAKALEKMGFKKSWQRRRMDNWSPGNYRGQSMSVREIGATAYAQVLTKYGFKAYMGSRAD